MLNSNQVEYLLVGGYAVGYHGYPRATGDIDIWVNAQPANITRVLEVLREFGFGSADLTPDLFLGPARVIRMGIPPVRIELLTAASGVDFEDCYAARTAGVLDGIEVSIISLDHLKINKQASGRPKDIADLVNLPPSR